MIIQTKKKDIYFFSFRWNFQEFLIITPLFLFYWFDYIKNPFSYIYYKGLEIAWKRRKNPFEGDLIFMKSTKIITDYLSVFELENS